MRVLLDGCVPEPLARSIIGHVAQSIHRLHWSDLDDRPLLNAVEGLCDAFVTVDKRLPTQQRIIGRSYGVIVLRAHSNRLNDLLPLVPELLTVLARLRPGEAVEIVPPSV